MTATSARGLFAATGNTLKPKPHQLEDGSFVLTTAPPREKDDFNPTPAEPIRAFLSAELERILDLGGAVWEASAGDGALVREMRAVGLNVLASDKIDRGLDGCLIRDFYDFSAWPVLLPQGKRQPIIAGTSMMA